MLPWLVPLILLSTVQPSALAAPIAPAATRQPLSDDEAERFLAAARVVTIEDFTSGGITRPRRALLSDGARERRAIFKTVDRLHPRVRDAGGRTLIGLRDSYKHEVAAYRLDRLIGLGMVPPCVERAIDGEHGALCLWIEDAMSEWQRMRQLKLTPPDQVRFSNQMAALRLFDELIWDCDSENLSNVLIDRQWRVYKIDSSRAFRKQWTVQDSSSLYRFPRRVVTRLRDLTRADLEDELGGWLTGQQIDGLWHRREAILELVDRRVAERGPALLY